MLTEPTALTNESITSNAGLPAAEIKKLKYQQMSVYLSPNHSEKSLYNQSGKDKRKVRKSTETFIVQSFAGLAG